MTFINKGLDDPYYSIDAAAAEKIYGAKYIGEFAILTPMKVWTESPVMVFYQPNPDYSKGHTNYFGLKTSMGQVYILDASSAAGIPMLGVESGGEIVYSRYRHDSRWTKDRVGGIDGGRDYCKRSGTGKEVWLMIDGPDVVIIDDPDPYFVKHKLIWGT